MIRQNTIIAPGNRRSYCAAIHPTPHIPSPSMVKPNVSGTSACPRAPQAHTAAPAPTASVATRAHGHLRALTTRRIDTSRTSGATPTAAASPGAIASTGTLQTATNGSMAANSIRFINGTNWTSSFSAAMWNAKKHFQIPAFPGGGGSCSSVHRPRLAR